VRLHTYFPLDFDQAFEERKFSPGVYALGLNLAAKSYRALNTTGGRVPVFLADLARAHGTSSDTIGRWLRVLKAGDWIDFPEPQERQREPWQITLTGLARQLTAPPTAPPTAAKPSPGLRQSSAAPPEPGGSESPHGNQDSTAAPLPLSRARVNETKRKDKSARAGAREAGSSSSKAKSSPRSEVSAFIADHGGKWPTGSRFARGSHGGQYVPDPLGYDWPSYSVPWGCPTKADIAQALRKRGATANAGNEEQPTSPGGPSRNGTRRRAHEDELDALLGPRQAGEVGMLADLEGLAAAGLGEWVEEHPPCRYPAHRGTDWRNDGGHLVCGVCHPPADRSRLEAQR
jgi:hypothetical protein